MADNRDDMKPEDKGADNATDKPGAAKPAEGDISKVQEDAAKERAEKGGYQ